MKRDDNFPVLEWRARPDMSCEYVNPAWLQFTGYTLEQALGQGWASCLHPEDLARWLETSLRAFDERAPFEIEYRLRRRDGEYRWIRECAAPRYDEAGSFLGFGAECLDIDARRRGNSAAARALSAPLLAGIRVLVIGAHPEACAALARPLELAGADVRVAASSAEALDTLGAWHPDVLLSEPDKPVEPVALLATVARLAA